MLNIDLRTVYLNFLMTEFIALVFLVILWYQNRKRYDGLHLIAADFLLHFSCVLLIFLRGFIPDFISIVVSNFFGILSGFIGFIGYSKFVGYERKGHYNYIMVCVFMLIHVYFTYLSPDLHVRNINLSFAFLFFCFQTAWVLLFKTPAHLRSLTRSLGLSFVLFGLINLIRILYLVFLQEHKAQNYFQSELFEISIPVLYQLVLLMICFFTVLTINRRLIFEISIEEKKLSIIYHSVPSAILISGKRSGIVLDINDGFEHISEYSRAEVIGKSTFDLKLWHNPTERDTLINKLIQKTQVDNLEFRFRRKSGELIDGQISCIQVIIDNQEYILSVINDITDKKKAENELKSSREILKRIVINLQSEHEKERITIATQIDNHLNQSLAALRINIGMLKKKLSSNGNKMSDEVLLLVDNTYMQTGTTIERSLALMSKMRNEVLYLLGFLEAVSFTIEEIEKKYHIRFSLESNTQRIDLEPNKSTTLFLVLQDLLNHILQQHTADSLWLKINQTDDFLYLILSENGNSFNSSIFSDENNIIAEAKEKIGLFNGFISIATKEESVTEITIEMPG